MEYLLDESGNSSPTARRLSSSKRRRRCFTGLELGRTSRECSVTPLGMPGKSEGLHAKMFVLARRKSMSTTSYLPSRVALICNTLLSEWLGSRGTFLIPSVGSKLPACRCVESKASFAILLRVAVRASSSA